MKIVPSVLLGLVATIAGVVVLLLWSSETVAWVGAAALIAAGIALVIASIVRTSGGRPVSR